MKIDHRLCSNKGICSYIQPNGSEWEGSWLVSTSQKLQWAVNKCIGCCGNSLEENLLWCFFKTDSFQNLPVMLLIYYFHFIWSISQLWLLVCGWVLLRIKSAKCFYLNFIFLWNILDNANRTWSVLVTTKEILVCNEIWDTHHWNFGSR